MIKRTVLPLLSLLLVTAAIAISAAGQPRVNRTVLGVVEKSFDDRLARMWKDNPQSLVGYSRAVYIDGYGVVLTAEMNMVTAPISLMHPSLTEEEKLELHKKKVERLPQLKAALREALVSTAASLDPVPANDQIVIVLILPHYSFEDTTGVPMQLTAQASKQQLLTAQRAGAAALDQTIKIIEN
jgi:hypothetical protein